MSSFKKDLISGSFYIGIAKYAGIVCQLAITAVLARLLTPADYGIIAIATVFIVFFNILSDLGIGVAVIQRKDLDERDLDHLYSINIYLGIILSILFFTLSGTISNYYENEELKPVCQLLSLMILFTCCRTVPMNLLYREKQFKYIAFTNLGVNVVCGVAAMLAALRGWGVYSLVLSQVMSALCLFIMYARKYRRHFYIKVDFTPLKRIFSYSLYNFIGTIFVYFTQNIDKILIGKYTGAEALGYYEKSYRLMQMPVENITFVVTPVLHPLLSEYQNDLQQLCQKYLRIVNAFAYLSFPIAALCFFIAKELVLIFFGNQWLDAIPVFQITCFAIAFMMLNSTVGSIFNASNNTKRGFYTGIVLSLLMIASISVAISLYNTIIAVAYAYLFARVVGTFYNFYSLMKGLNNSYMDFLKVLIKPALIGISLFVGLELFVQFITIENILLSLLVKCSIWFVMTLALVQWLSGYNIIRIGVDKVKSFAHKR